MPGEQAVEFIADAQNLLGMNIDVAGLALEAAQRLVNHDSRMRQCEPFFLLAGRQQYRAHAGCLADAGSADIGMDELHGVVNRHAGGDGTARAVDIQRDVLFRVFRFQEQQLRHDQVGHVVFDLADQEDHAFLEQA